MKAVTLAAGALAATLIAGAQTSRAADLDYGRVPYDRYSSAYEDPRYADIYGPGPGPGVVVPAPVPPAPIYRDRPRYYEPRYSYDDGARPGCIPREEIKRRLVSEGWRDFYDLELRGEVAKIKARRPSGDLYVLKVDRCTGDIANAHLLERGGHGPYAYDDRYRRY